MPGVDIAWNTEQGKRAGPSFLFIGPSKAGSSWFFEILREHPDVYVPPNKVTFFFTEHFQQGASWYELFFSKAGRARARGEVCHDYLASATAMRRIRSYNPDMRLICCLRNPYERALSSWRFFGRNGMDQPTLAAQGERTPSVFDQGYYATQLKFLNTLFPSNQLLTFYFEELAASPESVAARLYEFIGVRSDFLPPTLHRKVNVNAKPRLRALARFAQFVHAQSWKRSRSMSHLIGKIKEIHLLRRFVRAALYKETVHSNDWRDNLAEFPERIVMRYEKEITELENMVRKDLAHWHADKQPRAFQRTMKAVNSDESERQAGDRSGCAALEVADRKAQ